MPFDQSNDAEPLIERFEHVAFDIDRVALKMRATAGLVAAEELPVAGDDLTEGLFPTPGERCMPSSQCMHFMTAGSADASPPRRQPRRASEGSAIATQTAVVR